MRNGFPAATGSGILHGSNGACNAESADHVSGACSPVGSALRGGGSSRVTLPPITVNLPVATVTITQNGAPVTIPIQIESTSETALVKVLGLPAGVSETYAASDTNPSGTLTFTATRTASTGRFMPQVSVMSAGQTATAALTLVVQMH
jgi:hypothetical protein